MPFGAWVLLLLVIIALASLPLFPYSRKWGYGPGAVFLALLLICMAVMWLAGIVFWPWQTMQVRAT
jgi:hypothetical protein